MKKMRFEEKFLINVNKDFFNHLILIAEEDTLQIKHISASPRIQYTEPEMDQIQIKIQLIPQLLIGTNEVLFTFKEYYEFEDGDNKYSIGSGKDENRQIVFPVSFTMRTKADVIGFDFEWEQNDVEYDLAKRTYPQGIYWLIDTLKKVYNEWQKEHPNHLPL